MKLLKLVALAPILVLAAACAKSDGGGNSGATPAGPAAPGTPAGTPEIPDSKIVDTVGSTELTRNAWCFHFHNPNESSYILFRYKFNDGAQAHFTQFVSDANATRLSVQNDFEIGWSAKGNELLIGDEGYTTQYFYRIVAADNFLYLATRPEDLQTVHPAGAWKSCQ